MSTITEPDDTASSPWADLATAPHSPGRAYAAERLFRFVVRGLPVRVLSAAFLVVLGVGVAGASQVIGSLLVFALLVTPAATAVRLTSRPVLGMLLSVVLALAIVWAGEGVAFFTPYPVGFWVTTFAFGSYLVAQGVRTVGSFRAVASSAGRPGRQVAT